MMIQFTGLEKLSEEEKWEENGFISNPVQPAQSCVSQCPV